MPKKSSPDRPLSCTLLAVLAALLLPAIIYSIEKERVGQTTKVVLLVDSSFAKRAILTPSEPEGELDFEELTEEAGPVCVAPPVPEEVAAPVKTKSTQEWSPRKSHTNQMANRRPVRVTRITSKYGYRVHPVTKKYKFHNGLDYSAKLNQRVFSVADGVVMRCGPRGALGIAVEIYHPAQSASTIYGHLNEELVYQGQRVRSGQTIGLAGTTGRSTGVHVHFTVKKDCRYVEPSKFLASLPKKMRLHQYDKPIAIARAEAAAQGAPGRSLVASSGRTYRLDSAKPRRTQNHLVASSTLASGSSMRATAKNQRTASSIELAWHKGSNKFASARKISERNPRTMLAHSSKSRKLHNSPTLVARSRQARSTAALLASNSKVSTKIVATASSTAKSARVVARVADGERLAAAIAEELATTRAALLAAKKKADIALALYEEGAISANDAKAQQARSNALQEQVTKLEQKRTL